ncbi:hypothetical protein [Vibrio vulnificus YJ016]|uniref:Uncharacterized protein n=1 Tax=Vibrio vulnificus (strain YJ016) TaxID=196600 RepID=Q7MQF0_VIBVY|nr:hypothetical protein [Vibrio vulnificus YJ016]
MFQRFTAQTGQQQLGTFLTNLKTRRIDTGQFRTNRLADIQGVVAHNGQLLRHFNATLLRAQQGTDGDVIIGTKDPVHLWIRHQGTL